MNDSVAQSISPEVAAIDWSEVLTQHVRWLRAVLFARLGDADSVEEVLQEVSAAAVQQKQPVDPTTVSAWLYRVAVRQAFLHRRKAQRRSKRELAYAEAKTRQQTDQQQDPLQWLLSDERTRLVREALERLSRKERELVLLKYTEGWSYKEMAERLGLSESAVESRLHRARRRLREELTRLKLDEL